jgi:leader peptidase (prepilin peptidase)/N-methyltransferase
MAGAYKLLQGHDGLGDGDPPLMGLIGAFFGWEAVPVVLLWASLIGLAGAATIVISRRARPPEEDWAGRALPFGPAAALAALLYLLWSPV